MPISLPGQVTELLRAWNHGDPQALEQLIPLVEVELRRVARAYVARERRGHTLQPTALVNEAFCGSPTRSASDGRIARTFWASRPA